MLQNYRFSDWASRSGFGVAICVAIVRNSILCDSASADRNGMAASRFLAAAAACVTLLCFAAEGRKSHCNGCMKVANGALVTLVTDFSSFWRYDDFPVKISFKKCLKIVVFFAWASRSRFWGCNLCSRCAEFYSIRFCNSVSADRSGMAASRFLAAAAACVILLSFAAQCRKSYCSGCLKVATGSLAADISQFAVCSTFSV